MTAHQESNESKDAQKDAWHVSRFFAFILFQVNPLQADGIMANDTMSPEAAPASSEPDNVEVSITRVGDDSGRAEDRHWLIDGIKGSCPYSVLFGQAKTQPARRGLSCWQGGNDAGAKFRSALPPGQVRRNQMRDNEPGGTVGWFSGIVQPATMF